MQTRYYWYLTWNESHQFVLGCVWRVKKSKWIVMKISPLWKMTLCSSGTSTLITNTRMCHHMSCFTSVWIVFGECLWWETQKVANSNSLKTHLLCLEYISTKTWQHLSLHVACAILTFNFKIPQSSKLRMNSWKCHLLCGFKSVCSSLVPPPPASRPPTLENLKSTM